MSTTTRTIYFTNTSGIMLYAKSKYGDNITITESTIPSGAPNLPIATWITNDASNADDYGWIDLCRLASDTDAAYQIYFEFKNGGTNYHFIGHYDSSRSETDSNPSEFSSGVGSSNFSGGNYHYTFKGKTIEPHWQLKNTPTGAKEWQHMHPPATTWGTLIDHTCSLDIDQETTKVILQITNACGEDFYLTGQQKSGGSDSWSEERVPYTTPNTTWAREFPVNMATNDIWMFTVDGFYDPPSQFNRRVIPAISGKRRGVPDPTFQIKRSTTKIL